jgi:UDP-glucose:glycoprotein glucosyltransferase
LQTALALGYLSEPGALEFARIQLALHATSPKIQAFFQFYDDQHFPHVENCESWVDWYGERVCDVETLAHLAGHDTINAPNSTDKCVDNFNPG